MTQLRTKYQLPTCAKLPHIKFDLELMKQEVLRLNSEWVNLFQANRGLCSNHTDLAENNYLHFDQINLTYFEPSFNNVLNLDDLRKECRVLSKSEALGNTKIQKFRTKINRMPNLVPAMNEHNWYHPLPIYQGSYFQHAIESQFKAKPIRVRLTRIKPGKELTPHIDYGPEYAIRIIVPIMGSENVSNLIWNRGKVEEFNLVADGSAYFLNIGHRHAVRHDGDQDRICLMFSLAGQDDISTL